MEIGVAIRPARWVMHGYTFIETSFSDQKLTRQKAYNQAQMLSLTSSVLKEMERIETAFFCVNFWKDIVVSWQIIDGKNVEHFNCSISDNHTINTETYFFDCEYFFRGNHFVNRLISFSAYQQSCT